MRRLANRAKVPRRLRGDGDPLDDFQQLVLEFERLADAASTRFPDGQRLRPRAPVLVVAAATADALRLEASDVDLLSDSELAVAAQRAGMSEFDIGGASTEELRGVLTAVRGAAGEQWVLDRMEEGRLPVPDGTVGVDMLPFRTPGVDLRFRDVSGEILAVANVKVAHSADVIGQHFAKYPGVPFVYATSDAAEDARRLGWTVVEGSDQLPRNGPAIVDIGKSSSAFDHEMAGALDLESVMDGGIDLVESLPWCATAAITARALMRIRAGQSRAESARQVAQEGTVVAGAAGASALASTVTSSEVTVMLASFLVSSLGFGVLGGRRQWSGAADELESATLAAMRLANFYSSAEEVVQPPLSVGLLARVGGSNRRTSLWRSPRHREDTRETRTHT